MKTGQARKEKTHVGVRQISVSKFPEDVKVPLSQGTVSKSIKDSQDNPGSSSQQKADKIKKSGFLPDPSEHVEDYKKGMKDRKEDVKKFHPSLFWNDLDKPDGKLGYKKFVLKGFNAFSLQQYLRVPPAKFIIIIFIRSLSPFQGNIRITKDLICDCNI